MAIWSDLYNANGIYQSDVIDVSSNFDYYIVNKILDFQENDGEVDVQLRASFNNGISWTNWKSIIGNTYIDLFDGDGVKMAYTKFQFKILMKMDITTGVTPPTFEKITLVFTGGYKIENTGDIPHKPEIWIKKTGGSGSVSLTNEETGQTVSLLNLNDNETVYINNLNKDIKTDLPLTYRYSNHNREWLEFQQGLNVLTGVGNFELVVRHEFQVLQG